MQKKHIALAMFGGLTVAMAVGWYTSHVQSRPSASIREVGRDVAINVLTGTHSGGMAMVTLSGPPTPQFGLYGYSVALPVRDGRVAGNVTNLWHGSVNVSVEFGGKRIAAATVGNSQPALSQGEIIRQPSWYADDNIASVREQALAIGRGASTTTAAINATSRWVNTHVRFVPQSVPARADETMKTREGNDASCAALVAALLRANGVGAQITVEQAAGRDGYFGQRYDVDAWDGGKWLKISVPWQPSASMSPSVVPPGITYW